MMRLIGIVMTGLLLVAAPVWATGLPICRNIIASQSIGAGGTVSGTMDMNAEDGDGADYAGIDGVFTAIFLVNGTGDADASLTYKCGEDLATPGTVAYVAPHSSNTSTATPTITAVGTIVASTEDTFADETVHAVRFYPIPCDNYQFTFTELDTEASNVALDVCVK